MRFSVGFGVNNLLKTSTFGALVSDKNPVIKALHADIRDHSSRRLYKGNYFKDFVVERPRNLNLLSQLRESFHIKGNFIVFFLKSIRDIT